MKHILLGLALVWGLSCLAPAAAWAQTKDEPVDQELLEGLERELLDEDLPADEDDQPSAEQGENESAEDSGPKRSPEQGPPAGEDLGQERENPLSEIGEQMRSVERLLAKKDVSGTTRQQQEKILHDLDQLIRQARKQKKQSASSASNPAPGSQRSEIKQPSKEQQAGKQPAGSQSSTPGNKESNTPAQDSSDRLGPDHKEKVDMAEMQDLMKDLWGQLPGRARERMLQNSVEQFLPKYEVMIEKYFRRMAERSEDEVR